MDLHPAFSICVTDPELNENSQSVEDLESRQGTGEGPSTQQVNTSYFCFDNISI